MKELISLIFITTIFLGLFYKTSSQYPGDCDFFNRKSCGYKLFKQDWNWKIQNTTKIADHTLNSKNGGILSINPNKTSKIYQSRLFSPVFQPTGPQQRCLTFWYQIYGGSFTAFRVIVEETNKATTTGGVVVWRLNRMPNGVWQYAQVPVASNVTHIIHFEAQQTRSTRNRNPRDYIYIDDIIFTNGPCVLQPPWANTPTTPQLPPKVTEVLQEPIQVADLSCNFSTNNLCGWKQDQTNTLKWSLQNGPARLSQYTGPQSDHTGDYPGYYIYIDVKDKDLGQAARLISPNIPANSGKCLTFWYHMWGPDVNTLNVFIQTGDSTELVWSRKMTQGMDWKRASLSLTMAHDKIIFEAVAHKTSTLCSIALDDIAISKDFCIENEFFCDFESSPCDYRSSVGKYWARTGGRHISATSPVAKDHTFDSDYGHYMALDATQLDIDNEISVIANSAIDFSTPKCLEFWYYINIGVNTQLTVTTGSAENKLPYFESESYRDFYGSWQVAQTSLNTSTKLLFNARVNSKSDFIALDDIKITNGSCRREGACSFEDGNMCTWSNTVTDDDFDWELQNGATISLGTGPQTDHTLNSEDGTYLYIETSLPQVIGEKARLYSQGFMQTKNPWKCLHFWYNMVGKSIGKLTVFQIFPGGYEKALWQLRGDQGSDWEYAQVSFPSYRASYKLMIEATVGGDLGDIAIDDIVITDNDCAMIPTKANNIVLVPTIPPPTEPTPEEIYRIIDCNFEKDFCQWKNANTTIYNNWAIFNLTTSTSQFLPSGGDYTFAQIDLFSQNKNDEKFTLQTPLLITKTTDEELCFSFDYFMFGPNKGELTLYIDVHNDDKTVKSDIYWKKTKYSIDSWQIAPITLNMPNSTFQLRLEAILSYGNIIAVKNFQLSLSECMQKEEVCDFAAHTCGWWPATNTSIEWKFSRPINEANGPAIDHTSLTADGGIAYIQSGANILHRNLVSPKYSKYIGTQCLSFWYYMSGAGNGSLTVQLHFNDDENSTMFRNLWKRVGDRGKRWHRGQITISTYEEFRIAFVANFTSNKDNYSMAIDDIKMIPSECSFPGYCNFDVDFCGFTNDLAERADWMIGRGRTYQPRYISGPVADADGSGQYAYVDFTFGLWSDQPKSRLRSEVITGTKESKTFCLEFSYVKFGDSTSSLQVLLNRLDRLEGWEKEIWAIPDGGSFSQYTGWNRANVVFNCTVEFEIIFQTTEVTYSTFIGIDDITINPGTNCKVPETNINTTQVQDENYRCNFDDGTLCDWTLSPKDKEQHYTLWTVNTGANSMNNEPSFDHTTKTRKGFFAMAHSRDSYYNVRMSTNNTINDMRPSCFQFWYFAYDPYTSSQQSLEIILKTEDKQEIIIWERNSTLGGSWQFAQIDIKNFKNYQIILQCTVNSGSYTAYVALDDVVLLMSECPEQRVCSFDHGMCGFSQPRYNNMDWKITDIDKPKNFPLDHSTDTKYGNYLYLNTTTKPPHPHATLMSPYLPAGKHCVHFWYYTISPDSELIIQKEYRNVGEDLINYGSVSKDQWLSASAEADGDSPFQITFTGIPGTRESNLDIAIDDIEFTNGSCESRNFCHFEQDMCNWQYEKGSSFYWQQRSGHTITTNSNSQLFDHTLGLPNGHVMMVDTTYQRPGTPASLLSPVLTSDYNCFSFWYFAQSLDIGKITLAMNKIHQSIILDILTPTQTKKWIQVMINTNQTDLKSDDLNYVLGIHFTSGKGKGILAIDDFFLDTKQCEFSEMNAPETMCNYSRSTRDCGSCNFENGPCNYTDASQDVFQWAIGNRQDAKTATNGALDLPDHTTGTNKGIFMYTYTKHQATKYGFAILHSPRIKYTTATCHMTFWLFNHPLISSRQYTLVVSIVYLTGDTSFELYKNQETVEEWVPISVYIGSVHQPFKIEFKLSSYGLNHAIDDIKMTDCGPSVNDNCTSSQTRCNDDANSPCYSQSQECDFNNDCGNGEDEQNCSMKNYTMCSFEQGDMCIWKSDEDDGWKTQRPVVNYINRDHTTNSAEGMYLLVTNLYSRSSRVTSRTFEAGNCTMRFHYLISGPAQPQLNILTLTANKPEKMWFSKSRKWGNYFIREEIQFNVESDFMISLEAKGVSYYGFIAVDDISFEPNCQLAEYDLDEVAPKQCNDNQFPCGNDICIDQSSVCDFYLDCNDGSDERDCGTCNFENELCGWSDAGVGAYKWKRMKGIYEDMPSTVPIKDHTSNSLDGSFMSVVKTNAHSVLPNAYLESPVLGKTSTKCKLSFAYQTLNSSGQLNVNVKHFMDDFEMTIATLPENGNGSWKERTIPLGRLKPGFQIVFEADVSQDHLDDRMPDFVIDDTEFIDCSAYEESNKPSYPNLECNFETETTCNWYQELLQDDLNWEVAKALVNGTGPGSDHTSEKPGHYLFVQSPNQGGYSNNMRALLMSPVIPATDKETCLMFWYHIFGERVGSIGVSVANEKDLVDDNDVWMKYGSQGNVWRAASVNIDKQLQNFRLIIWANVETNSPHIISIDDISYTNSSCLTGKFEYNFETNDQSWVNKSTSTTLDNQWEVVRFTSMYGLADHTTRTRDGHALHYFAQSPMSNATVTNPTTFYSSNEGSCFQFWYLMSDTQSTSITIAATRNNELIKNKTYVAFRTQEWNFGQLTIPPNISFQIDFTGGTTSKFGSAYRRMFLDDFIIRNESCLPDGSCDFESSTCGWTPYYGTNTIKWLRSSAETPSKNSGPKVDHTTETKEGFYIYLDSSLGVYGDAAVRSPELRSVNQTACFSFFYHMAGKDIGELHITATLSNSDSVGVYQVQGSQQDKWIPAHVEMHNLTDVFTLLISGTVASGPNGDIAIDDLSVIPGNCPQKMVKPPITTTVGTTVTTTPTTTLEIKTEKSTSGQKKTSLSTQSSTLRAKLTTQPDIHIRSTNKISTNIPAKSTITSKIKPTQKGTKSPIICAKNELLCSAKDICIKSIYWCDGIKDCPDESDEKDCVERKCADGEFSCAKSPEKCIKKEMLCDGFNNCPDASDESQCKCYEDLCTNSATCSLQNNLAVCNCGNDFQGNRCQYEALKKEPEKSGLGWIAGVVISILLVIALIAIYFKKFRKPNVTEGSPITIDNPSYEESTEYNSYEFQDMRASVDEPDETDHGGIVNPLYN